MGDTSLIGEYTYYSKPIGKGAFSHVFKGINNRTGETVAVKVISRNRLDAHQEARLRDEVVLMERIDNPYIVKVIDFIEDGESFYFILEYCGGGDLSKCIKRGRVSEKQAKRFTSQLADALQYLKSRDIVHRDLKPHNIMLDEYHETVKLTDFNFARELLDNELAETLCGSPLYMAPEIIANNDYTAKADLWSIGLIIYEMVYGRHPYQDSKNIIDLLDKIYNKNIEYDNDLVSEECNNLLRKLLNINPINRCSWLQFFSDTWLYNDACDNIDIPTPSTYKLEVVDDYVPLSSTPPRYTRSEPVDIYRRNSGTGRNRSYSAEVISKSAPDKSVTDSIWKYMTSSANSIKSIISSSPKRF